MLDLYFKYKLLITLINNISTYLHKSKGNWHENATCISVDLSVIPMEAKNLSLDVKESKSLTQNFDQALMLICILWT